MVVGNRIGKRRELCRVGSGVEVGLIQADACNGVYFKDRIVGCAVGCVTAVRTVIAGTPMMALWEVWAYESRLQKVPEGAFSESLG